MGRTGGDTAPTDDLAREVLALADVPAAVLVFEKGNLCAANAAARALLWLDADASLAEIVLVLDPQRRLGALLRSATRDGSPSQLRFDTRLRDGAALSLQLHAAPSGTQPDRLVVLAYDDTPHQDIEKQLQRRLLFERLLTETSAALIRSNNEQLDATIVDMLGAIGAFFGVDRAYVFLIDAAAGSRATPTSG